MSKINHCVAYGLAGFLAGAITVLAMSAFAQPRQQQYKVITREEIRSTAAQPPQTTRQIGELYGSALSEYAAQGWRLHTFGDPLIIFERR